MSEYLLGIHIMRTCLFFASAIQGLDFIFCLLHTRDICFMALEPDQSITLLLSCPFQKSTVVLICCFSYTYIECPKSGLVQISDMSLSSGFLTPYGPGCPKSVGLSLDHLT